MKYAHVSTAIDDPSVLEVMARLWETEGHQNDRAEGQAHGEDDYVTDLDPYRFPDVGFSISPAQGDLLYSLVRFGRPDVIMEFATSLGFSALYLTAALRDNGRGHLYSSELIESKAWHANENLSAAGLADYATILIGDARQTLASTGQTIDLLLLDGWPTEPGAPSLAFEVLQRVESSPRPGAIIVNDNGEPDYLTHARAVDSGYSSFHLPWNSGTEITMRI